MAARRALYESTSFYPVSSPARGGTPHRDSMLSDATSDSDVELHSKRPKFLTKPLSFSRYGARSRSSSPCSSSSPGTPGGIDIMGALWDSTSSPRAGSNTSSSNGSGSSHWAFYSPKVLKLSKSLGKRWGFRRSSRSSRKEKSQRPMILEQLPLDDEERADYMTVVVGERKGKRENYVINKHLLTHHLFQTLLKCSEDIDIISPPEFRSGVLIFCDPALFLHLVDVAGSDLAAAH